MIVALEASIDHLVHERPLRSVLVVPGANLASATMDLPRTAARRAEREVVELAASRRSVAADVIRYLNRLSDLLYVLARQAADDDEPASHQ